MCQSPYRVFSAARQAFFPGVDTAGLGEEDNTVSDRTASTFVERRRQIHGVILLSSSTPTLPFWLVKTSELLLPCCCETPLIW